MLMLLGIVIFLIVCKWICLLYWLYWY